MKRNILMTKETQIFASKVVSNTHAMAGKSNLYFRAFFSGKWQLFQHRKLFSGKGSLSNSLRYLKLSSCVVKDYLNTAFTKSAFLKSLQNKIIAERN